MQRAGLPIGLRQFLSMFRPLVRSRKGVWSATLQNLMRNSDN